MAEGANSLERELEAEVRDFEIRMARLEGQLDEKRSLLDRLRLASYDAEPTGDGAAETSPASAPAAATTAAPADRAAAMTAALPTVAASAERPEAPPLAPVTTAAAPEAQPPPARARDGAAAAGRHTISVLGKHHYEVDGLRFSNAGQMLDHLDVPHYFSRKYPKQGDAAAREVMRWAKRNPSLAGGVTVVLADGARMGLDAAVRQVWP